MVSKGAAAERRRDDRFAVKLPVQVDNTKADIVNGETIDISSRGCLCLTPKHIPEMTRVRIVLDIANSDIDYPSVACDGVVVRSTPVPSGEGSKVAIYFLNLEKGVADLLETLYAGPSH